MIHLVNSENREQFRDLIQQMHLHRGLVFVEELGWNVTTRDGLEIDAFDTDHTIYLLSEEDGVLQASARLNPTNRPHLMSEVFSHLCEKGVPADDRTWELSRLCPNPATLKRGRERRPAGRKLLCGILELGLVMGWQRLTMAVGLDTLPFCLRCGWDVTPLGLPQYHTNRDLLAAFSVNITPAGLQAVRTIAHVDTSVLEVPREFVAAAA